MKTLSEQQKTSPLTFHTGNPLARIIRRRFSLLFLINIPIVAFLIAPLVVVIIAAFGRSSFLEFPPSGLTLRWFAQLAGQEQLVLATVLSLKLAAGSSLLGVLLGVPAALSLERMKFPGVGVLRTLVTAPLIVPSIVTAIAILLFFGQYGLQGTFTGLLIAHTVLALPFTVSIVSAGLRGVGDQLEEPAQSLGASKLWAVVSVTLPAIRSSIFAGAAFAFLMSFDEVVVTLFLSGPGLQTLPVYIFQYIQYSSDPFIAATASIMIFFIIAVGVIYGAISYAGGLVKGGAPLPKTDLPMGSGG